MIKYRWRAWKILYLREFKNKKAEFYFTSCVAYLSVCRF
jgi:hypothetical protein